MALLPSTAAALGRWRDAETGEPDILEPARGEARMPLARAAVLAAKHGGTEVGREVGSAARAGWGILRHRRRRQITEPVVPEGAEGSGARPDGSEPNKSDSSTTAAAAGSVAPASA